MKIAYLINQYPAISHSFVRREIDALERAGTPIARYAIRPSSAGILSPEDARENDRTRHIVGQPKSALIMAMARTGLARPGAALSALGDAIRLGWRSEAGLVRTLIYWAESLVVARWLMADDIDHLHAHFGTNSATVAMLAAAIARKPFSITVHGPEEFDKPALIALPEKIERSAFVAGVSSFGVSQLRRLVSYDHWNKLHVIHCGIEPAYWEEPLPGGADANPDRASSDGPSSDDTSSDDTLVAGKLVAGKLVADAGTADARPPLFVSVGRLSEQKGQMTLLEAARRLKDRGHQFRLQIIGDGPLRKPLEKAIADWGLGGVVDLAGWKTPAEVRAALHDCAVFVLPSFAEGLPVSIMEAFAMGKPVISTYVAGIPELVIDGVNGWLAPAADAGRLADVMAAAIAASPEARAAMGADGLNRVRARHHIDIEAQKLRALFQSGGV